MIMMMMQKKMKPQCVNCINGDKKKPHLAIEFAKISLTFAIEISFHNGDNILPFFCLDNTLDE